MNIYFIPARAGSKRVPGKNYSHIGSKPLISYSIDFAISVANDCDIIVVSTDCPIIVEIASSYKNRILIDERCPHLASDSSKMIDVAIDFLNRNHTIQPSDTFILLQPTTPFREPATLLSLFSKYHSCLDYSSAFSVVDVDFYHPSKVGSLTPYGEFKPVIENSEDNIDNKNKNPYYVISGSFYLSSVANLFKYESFIGPHPVAVIEDNPNFVNIDNPHDLMLADFISSRLS